MMNIFLCYNDLYVERCAEKYSLSTNVNLSISTITAPDSRKMIKSLPQWLYIQMYTNDF